MMKKILYYTLILVLTACTQQVENPVLVNELPPIFPDYVDVTIPASIAPMNFAIEDAECIDVVVNDGAMHVNGDYADFDEDQWHELLGKCKGGKLKFTVCALKDGRWIQYKPFNMYVSKYALEDYGLTYRRIHPGYEIYSKMGLYQRCLSDFTEEAIIENTASIGSCVNCHTSNHANPSEFTFHVRGPHGATLIQRDGKREWLKAKNELLGGSMVYPYWHPSGKFCAFSTNKTHQAYHVNPGERIEVYDEASDVFVYNVETHEIITDSLLMTDSHFETYPAFSPDGKTLYFVSSESHPIPSEYKQIRYSLCKIQFDAETGTYGNVVDTLLKADDTTSLDSIPRKEGRYGSCTFPRPSYDGRYLMFTMSDYGCFPIWHKEADLWLMDLRTGHARPLNEVNSDDTESFHSWSSDSHWFVFSSRRYDGLYTQLFLSSIGADGKATKPFLLPQKDPLDYYAHTLYSFNVPDFTKCKVQFDASAARREIDSDVRVETKAR